MRLKFVIHFDSSSVLLIYSPVVGAGHHYLDIPQEHCRPCLLTCVLTEGKSKITFSLTQTSKICVPFTDIMALTATNCFQFRYTDKM